MRVTSSLLPLVAVALGACASAPATTASLGGPEPRPETVRERSAGERAPLDLSLTAALQAPGMAETRPQPSRPQGTSRKPVWRKGQTLMQGYLGANEFETVQRTGGSLPPLDGSDESLSRMPAIGGGGQWKLGGQRVDFGLELMIAFAWRANATAFAFGGGGAAIAVDVDLFLIDLYGGPFLSVFLGERWRVYGALGPMLQWGTFDESSTVYDNSASGFGTGVYARTGLEFRLRPGLMLGGGVRWTDSTLDLGSDGDLEIDGFQWAVTVTTGI